MEAEDCSWDVLYERRIFSINKYRYEIQTLKKFLDCTQGQDVHLLGIHTYPQRKLLTLVFRIVFTYTLALLESAVS